jgi:hypothetical protein
VVKKKKTTDTDWFLTRDIRVRFTIKRSVLTAYEQQRAPVKNKDDNNSRILTHDGHSRPTIIPIGHVSNESTDASMHKILVSCDLIKGKDSGELPALFRDSLNDIYEDLILNHDIDFCPPENLIDYLVTSISATESQNEANITTRPINLLYLFEFSRIYKIGGIASPYATIEWSGV